MLWRLEPQRLGQTGLLLDFDKTVWGGHLEIQTKQRL